MEGKSTKRKFLRRKYKRYAAAVAGAAILTGAMIPGIPAAKVLAAEHPAATTQAVKVTKDTYKPGRNNGWHEHRNSWPGSNENQARYENGRIYYRSANYRTSSDPIEVVKNYANYYGFDQNNDSFKIVAFANGKSTVQVIRKATGQQFLFELERNSDRSWSIVSVRG